MGKLTDLGIKGFIKAGQKVAKSDGDGLVFTMSEAQAREKSATWILRYRFDGKAKELTLGRYPDLTLAKARELATEQRVRIQQGKDVAREKQRASIERAAAKSLTELAQDYMAKRFPDLAKNTIQQRRHHIEDVILPKLGKLAAQEINTADVVALVESVGKKSINVAELVFTAMSEIFKHGVARHVVTSNPCAGISVSAICGKPKPVRQRLMLTEAELRALLPELPTIGLENALTVKLLLVTCVRIGELSRAEWSHIDFDRAEWTIPDENSKTGRGFTVPLPTVAVGWLRELKVLACDSRYVFPARQVRRIQNIGGDTYFDQRALNAMLHKLCGRLAGKVRRFTPHDLRSTARSHLSKLGVPILVAERCLNHSLGGLVGIYDQHDYMDERRKALAVWSDFVVCCESGKEWRGQQGKVIEFAARASA